MCEYARSYAWRVFWCAVVMISAAASAHASINEIMQAIKESEFRFAREGSLVPFVAVSWAQERFYPNTDFEDPAPNGSHARFSENVFNQGLMYPAYIGKRDMFIVGEGVTYDKVDIKAGDYPDQAVVTLTPLAAWLRQINRNNMAAAFVAPMFSRQTARSGDWGTKCFAGIVALYWKSETFQWAYGGVYEYSFGKNYVYPYGGFIWAPAPKWSVEVIFPWPTISYAPRDRWLLTLGAAPGGSAWVETANGIQTTYSFYTWTVTAGAAWRFCGKFWLYAGAGISGLRSFDLTVGDSKKVLETKPGAVFTIAIQLRP